VIQENRDENPKSGSTRGLRERRYGDRIEAYRETVRILTDAYNHCPEVLLYQAPEYFY